MKGPTRCNSMLTFIHCHVTLHVLGVTHPSSGVLKTVSATSGVSHGNGPVTSFHRGLIRTAVRIGPRWKEVTVPLPWHTPEVADTVFSTPDDGCVRPETCRVTWQWINVCILLHRVGPLLTMSQHVATFCWGSIWTHCRIRCLKPSVLAGRISSTLLLMYSQRERCATAR